MNRTIGIVIKSRGSSPSEANAAESNKDSISVSWASLTLSLLPANSPVLTQRRSTTRLNLPTRFGSQSRVPFLNGSTVYSIVLVSDLEYKIHFSVYAF